MKFKPVAAPYAARSKFCTLGSGRVGSGSLAGKRVAELSDHDHSSNSLGTRSSSSPDMVCRSTGVGMAGSPCWGDGGRGRQPRHTNTALADGPTTKERKKGV